MAAARISVDESNAIRSIFVPPFGIQGQELSCHVMWEREYRIGSLELRLDRGLECIHIYNVEETDFKVEEEGRLLTIFGVRENGYVGLVLKSAVLESNDKRLTVRVDATFDGGKAVSEVRKEYKIRLFRPDLRLQDNPEEIRVNFPKAGITPSVGPKVTLKNDGRGTALVVLLPAEDAQVKLVDYFEMDKERDRYVSLLKERLDGLKSDYPSLVSLIEKLVEFLEAIREQSEPAILSTLEDLKSDMVRAEREEPDFIEDLGGALFDAFLAAFTLDLRFRAWVQGLESTREQRVLLLNPWSSIPVQEGKSKVSLTLRHFDLNGHEYPEISLGSFVIESNDKGLVPAFELIAIRSASEPEAMDKRGQRGWRRRKG
jgi:hypothetical protein